MRTSMKLKTASGPAPLLSIDKDIVRITDIEPLELARQLTLLEFDIFQRIEVRQGLCVCLCDVVLCVLCRVLVSVVWMSVCVRRGVCL